MAPKSNRIEVDLNVLQQEAIAKLESFGKDFNNTVTRLASLLQNVETSVGTGEAGTLGPNASTPGATDQGMKGVTEARMGGTGGGTTPPLNAAGGTGGYDEGSASTPDSVEQQFVRLQRRIGANEQAVPTSLRQALGYAAEGQLNLNPLGPIHNYGEELAKAYAQIDNNPNMSDAEKVQAKKSARYRTMAGTANDLMFNYEASRALAMRGMGKYTGFTMGIQHITDYGYQTAPNTGTGGILGSSLFSGSFWHGLNESTWQPLISSTFGLNPAYSLGQAQQARQAINSYGWSSGNMGNWLAGVLKENTIRYRLDPQTQMQFLDPMLRWGGWQSFAQLQTVLQSIPSAAQAAGMNLSQFTQELTQTAQQVAQSTGNTPGTVAGILSNFSATTGLAPQQGADLLSTQNILMEAGYSGKNPWDIYTGKDQGAILSVPLVRYQQMLGMPVGRFMSMARGTPQQKEFFKNRMWMMTMMYSQNPQMFGGMSPLQLMNILKRNGGVAGAERHMQIQGDIEHLGVSGGPGETAAIEKLLRQFAPGPGGNALVRQFIAQGGAKMAGTQQRAFAEQLLRKQMHNKQLRASRKITIELSGDAKKYFSLQGDPGHVNSGGIAGFGRKALSFTEGALNDATGGALGGIESIANMFP